jgi:hypothetical protein
MILSDSPYTVLVEYLVVLWDGQSPHPATIVEVMILVSADQKHNKVMTQELAEKKAGKHNKLQIMKFTRNWVLTAGLLSCVTVI